MFLDCRYLHVKTALNMKTLATFLAVVTCVFVHGQDNLTPEISKTIFKVSPFHFTQNTLKVGIETFNTAKSKSLSIYGGVRTGGDDEDPYAGSDNFDGVLGEIQYKKYVLPLKEYTSKRNNTYSQGVYAGVFIQGGNYTGTRLYQEYFYDPNTGNSTTTDFRYKEDAWNAAIGFTLGAQRVFWNTLFVDVYIGGGLQVADRTLSGNIPTQPYYDFYVNNSFQPGYEGIIPKIGIQIGMGL